MISLFLHQIFRRHHDQQGGEFDAVAPGVLGIGRVVGGQANASNGFADAAAAAGAQTLAGEQQQPHPTNGTANENWSARPVQAMPKRMNAPGLVLA